MVSEENLTPRVPHRFQRSNEMHPVCALTPLVSVLWIVVEARPLVFARCGRHLGCDLSWDD